MDNLSMPLTAFPGFFEYFKRNPKPLTINLLPSEKEIIVSDSMEYSHNDLEKLQIDNLRVINTMHGGGTFVTFPGGITVAILDTESPKGYMKTVAEYLKSRGINATIDNNDILCDGYKVSGQMCRYLSEIGYFFYGIFISINADADIINKICEKPMDKVPRGLSYYGITRADILNVLHVRDE